jgi:hypothetical protein
MGRRLALRDRVVLTGYRRTTRRPLVIADVGILTSIREGLPRV